MVGRMELTACFLSQCSKMHIKVDLNDASKIFPRIQKLLNIDPGNVVVHSLETTLSAWGIPTFPLVIWRRWTS